MNDIQKQKPFTISQIESEKPVAPRTQTPMSGFIANSMNGGHNKTITYKQVMAGEKHYEYRLKMNIQMLTPKTPTYQNLKMTIRTYFVPNSRVWKNAEAFTAQKGGASEIKINTMPNLTGKTIPVASNGADINDVNGVYTHITNTTLWRDSFISSYITRVGDNVTTSIQQQFQSAYIRYFPPVSILGVRGRVAIYNDMERNKEFDEEVQEFNGDEVSKEELNSYLPLYANNMDYYSMRAKRENNYYTNFRTEYQGFDSEFPPENMNDENNLVTWASWESKIAEARSEAENAQLNDWQIIAKIRGSKLLSEGKVQKIGEKSFNLNYAAITQNTYNNNEEISEEFRVMGKQGAYSYTQVDIPLYAGMEFVEEGYIHVIATVSSDNVFETGIDRNELNINALDRYRPDMEGDKLDVLYKCESGTFAHNLNLPYYAEVEGFKRKYSELFKLPNVIGGDMTTINYYKPIFDQGSSYEIQADKQVITQKTFQFFEVSKDEHLNVDGTTFIKAPWKDYTDLQINKNQAIPNSVTTFGSYSDNGTDNAIVEGQNQIFFMGVATALVDLPVNEEIKKNYTQWGEH